MKTHELAACLETTAKILRELPDGELAETLELLLKVIRKNKSQHIRNRSNGVSNHLPPELVEQLGKMSPAQIEQFLRTSEEFADSERLRDLADHLGIKRSRRQNHAALVNSIVRHFEARRMDSIIRGSQANDDRSGEPS